MDVLAGCLLLFFVLTGITAILSAVFSVDEKRALLAAFSTLYACVAIAFAIACGNILGGGWWVS